MSCELNEGVPCEDCTLKYCQDMIDDALKDWQDLNDLIKYYNNKLDDLEQNKQDWLNEHSMLLK